MLRSWEKEFPGIGVQKSQDSPRLYRQSDVEKVLRIKQLVFGEGLTLAGARRHLEATPPPADAREAEAAERAEVLDTLGADMQARIELVRSGLRSILRKRGITSVYSLRHTAAQSMLDAKVPIEDVARLLGHSDLRTVGVYAQIRNDRAREVASSLASVLHPPSAERSRPRTSRGKSGGQSGGKRTRRKSAKARVA